MSLQSDVGGASLATTRAVVKQLLVLLGCTRETKSTATASAPPEVGAPAPAPVPLSRFSVPLEYDVTAVLRLVDQVVPTTFGSMDSVKSINGDSRKHYAFEARRGKFTAFASGREMHLRATLAYAARGFYKPPIGPTLSAGCGGKEGERPRIVLELATPLSLTPDWHLVSHARIVTIKPATTEQRDRCDVGILHTDVTDRVLDAAKSALQKQLPSIDRKVGTVSLAGHVDNWWAMLSRPIPLTKGVWLTLQPEQLRMGPVSGEAKVLTVPVTLDARPRIVTGSEAPAVRPGGPPPLAKDTMSNGFRIAIEGLVDYGTANRALTNALAHRKLTKAGRSVTVQDVTVLPATRGRLLLELSFFGDASGRLRLSGTPKYDARRNEVSVPDLDYDLDTESKIVNAYEWLKSDELRAMMREKAHLSAAPALEKGRSLLLSGLNRKLGDAVTLSATVDSVAVNGLYVTRDGLMLRAEATGQARVAVKQK
jgi:hypothetical protein